MLLLIVTTIIYLMLLKKPSFLSRKKKIVHPGGERKYSWLQLINIYFRGGCCIFLLKRRNYFILASFFRELFWLVINGKKVYQYFKKGPIMKLALNDKYFGFS